MSTCATEQNNTKRNKFQQCRLNFWGHFDIRSMGLINVLIPGRLESIVVFRGILNGVLSLRSDDIEQASEPIDQKNWVVEMLCLCHFLIRSHLTNKLEGFCAINFYPRVRTAALTD